MKRGLLLTPLAVLSLAGCQPRERINIERQVQQQPAPDIQATVLPDPAPVTKAAASSAAKDGPAPARTE